MFRAVDRPLRPAGMAFAAVLACSSLAPAFADDRKGWDDRERGQHSHGKPPPQASGPAYKKGVVAVANPYGAEAGASILERGGNAVDAAVAIAYALNVVEPQSAGIGGGGFMMIHLERGSRTFVIDTREKAPAGATPDMFVGVPNSSLQGVAVGVPGMVRGTADAVRKYGKLDLREVLRPAIQLADEGFAATPRYAAVSCNSRSQNSPESAAFFCPGGAAPVAGSLVQNKPLAQTFKLIARHGPDCFYKYMPHKGCDIAKGIVEGQNFAKPGLVNGVLTPGLPGVVWRGARLVLDLNRVLPRPCQPPCTTISFWPALVRSPITSWVAESMIVVPTGTRSTRSSPFLPVQSVLPPLEPRSASKCRV